MIRLPKLFKRKPQSDNLDRGSEGARRTTKKFTPRALQRAFEIQEDALTEDPEQQRARHRLIGAAVLVLIAVVGLPRIVDNKPKADTPAKPTATSTGSGKFVLQIGAFASEDRVNGWVSKLKAQKIPNIVTAKKGADGVTLFLLRAGPFPDKDSADTAEKKVKAMGLTPRLVEVGSP